MNGLGRCGIYTNGILLSHKKEQNNAICSNMDGTRDSHTKWSKSERERQIPYDITYIWNLIWGTNESIYRKKTKCPSTDEWIKSMWYIYTMEYYSAIKRTK